jgi:hypothetical protein
MTASVPGSRDEALTDDIIEAGARAWAAEKGWQDWDELSRGFRSSVKVDIEVVLAAVVPLLRAQWEAENVFDESALLAGVDAEAARVARGGDHA